MVKVGTVCGESLRERMIALRNSKVAWARDKMTELPVISKDHTLHSVRKSKARRDQHIGSRFNCAIADRVREILPRSLYWFLVLTLIALRG